MLAFLTGRKTYIAAAIMLAVTALRLAEVITQEQADAIYALAVALGLVGVRAAIATAPAKPPQ